MRVVHIVAAMLSTSAFGDEIPTNGNAALESCISSAASTIREKALADGKVKTMMDQIAARDAQIAALQRQLDARPKEAPK